MHCQEFEEQWAELEDCSSLTPELEEHRRSCPSCAELVADVCSIAQEARLLWTQPPPERLWLQIRGQLEKEGLIWKPPRWSAATSLSAGWIRLARGFAYASVFVTAGAIVYLYSVLSTSPAPPQLTVSPQPPPVAMEPQLAERDQKLQELVERMPAEHRATFVANWNQVNSSIEQLTNFVETHPDDPFVRMQLMNAFQQREHLWETLVRWDQF